MQRARRNRPTQRNAGGLPTTLPQMTTVFLNGAFVDRDDAKLSAFDAGLLHAVGLFETMLARSDPAGPRVIALRPHLERLAESARELRLSEDLRIDGLADACLETVRRAGYPRARLRLTVTGGDLNLLEARGRSNHTPTVLIVAQPAAEYPPEMYDRGVTVTVADARANPLDPTAGHKTLNYWWRLRELQIAAAKGAGEALVFQVSNHAAGGCVSNLFAIRGDRAYTPIARGEEREVADAGEGASRTAVPSPVLPGITRAMAIGWLEEHGLEVHRQMLTIDDLLGADELLLTNSGFGILPVVRLESREIGAAAPGEAGRHLIDRWRAAAAN